MSNLLFAGALRGLRAQRGGESQREVARGAEVQFNRLRDFEQGRAMPWLTEWINLWAYLSSERPPEPSLDEKAS